jgi:hypothetical protein
MTLELAWPRLDPTYLVVMAWIIGACAIALWYLLKRPDSDA